MVLLKESMLSLKEKQNTTMVFQLLNRLQKLTLVYD